ncbi:FACT complex subunit spt16 [Asimina triloba]
MTHGVPLLHLSLHASLILIRNYLHLSAIGWLAGIMKSQECAWPLWRTKCIFHALLEEHHFWNHRKKLEGRLLMVKSQFMPTDKSLSESQYLNKLLHAIQAQLLPEDDHHTTMVGYNAEERSQAELLETGANKLLARSLQLTDVTNGFLELLYVRNEIQAVNLKKAAYLVSCVMKHSVVLDLNSTIHKCIYNY